jgi:putative peptidoglycan lipid II flippase
LDGIRLRFGFRTEGVRQVIVAWAPLVIGAGVAQISGLVDTFLGSFTGEGGLASLGYAQLVQVLPISLFGVSVAAVSLPELARDATASASEQLRGRIATGFRRIAFFVIPSAFAFVALGPTIIGVLFQTGQFDANDTTLVGGVLAAYGIGLLGQSTVKLFASGFYALRDTRTPVKIAVASLVVSAVLSWVFMRRFGPAGIALGSSVGGTLNMVSQLRVLDRRVGRVLHGRDWRNLSLIVIAALGASALAFALDQLLLTWGPVPKGIAVMGIFGVTYGALTLAFRHPDATRAWQSLTGSPAN